MVPGGYIMVPRCFIMVPGSYIMVPGGYVNKGVLVLSCFVQLKINFINKVSAFSIPRSLFFLAVQNSSIGHPC